MRHGGRYRPCQAFAPGLGPFCLGATLRSKGREGEGMSALDDRADRLAQVRAQVAYHGQRLALYQRLHGSAPSARLAELEHAYTNARKRLDGAAAQAPSATGTASRPE